VKIKKFGRRIRNILEYIGKHISICKFAIIDSKSKKNLTDIAVIYTLTDYQQKDVMNLVTENVNKNNFPINVLNNKRIYIIQSSILSRNTCKDVEIILVPNPILYLLINYAVTGNVIMKIKEIVKFLWRNPEEFRRFKFAVIVNCLNSYSELDIFTTISGVKEYPTEFKFAKKFRIYRTHVIHYSQNSVAITFEDEHVQLPENSIVDRDSLGDVHWVWTKSYAEYLQKFNSKIEYIAVGSITFKKNKYGFDQQRKKIITLFDVTPYTILEGKSFYSLELAKRFLEDIIEIKNKNEELSEFEIQIKQKRPLDSNVHVNSYLNQLQELEMYKKVRIIPWDANPYEIISQSRLIISVPFTSIALVGNEMKVSSIYYYPFLRKISNSIYSNEIPLICGFEQLEEFVKEEVKL
jgi:polysaccharide biosynthesis PFTS motif protein